MARPFSFGSFDFFCAPLWLPKPCENARGAVGRIYHQGVRYTAPTDFGRRPVVG